MPKELELLLTTLKNHFSPSPYDDIIFLLLILPALAGLVWIFVYKNSKQSKSEINIPSKELEMYRIISFQKGLHDFDRKLLLELVINHQIRPLYQVLLDKNAFIQLISKIKEQNPPNENVIQYLHNIGNKIFVE